jgi:hypothetical protein
MISNARVTDPEVRRIVEKMAALNFDPGHDSYQIEDISMLMEELFVLQGREDVGELLVEAVREGILSPSQAELALGIGTWSGATNGADLQPTMERWLEEAEDHLKVQLSLSIGVYPFREAGKMASVLARVAARMPAFAEVCGRLVESRRRRSQETVQGRSKPLV